MIKNKVSRMWYFRLILILLCCSSSASAVTVNDSQGTFRLDYIPKRIVALEFSFVDALVAINMSPIGIADDNDPTRLLPSIKNKLGPWTSVGTRSQPSLEVIASLKPDLIIADVDRHSGVYKDLVKIAPTLLLPSRRETYQDNLKSAAIIGKAVGKDAEIQARLIQHKKLLAEYAKKLSGLQGTTIQFGVARENSFYAHDKTSYVGDLLSALGLESPEKLENYGQITLEQLLGLNPDYLVVGDYTKNSIVSKWQKQTLWKVLKAVRNEHVFHVDGNMWARCRGILAAEYMADDLVKIANTNE